MIAALRTDERDRRTRTDQLWALAGIVALICLVAAISFAIHRPSGRNALAWRSLGLIVHAETGFEIGGITFGMTPSRVRRLQPESRAGIDAFGRTVMSFSHEGTNYTVWFLDQKNAQLAYRIRLVRVIDGGREDDVLIELGNRFGRPVTGECETQMVSKTRDCTYTWRVADVAVSALVQPPPPVGSADSVALRLTAENVMLAARLDEMKPGQINR